MSVLFCLSVNADRELILLLINVLTDSVHLGAASYHDREQTAGMSRQPTEDHATDPSN